MAKRLLHKYTFSAGTDTVAIDGNWSREKLLLITNVTDNIIIYNFADPNLRATSYSYNSTTDKTTVVLNYDCNAMVDTDILQIFVEEEAVAFKPSQTFIDPVSKIRVSQGETLIDTDFEYGLQYTKWETLELVNNIPGFYSKTGDTPLAVTAINVVDGSRTITVTAPSHGQTVGTPVDVRGLSQTALEGSYIVTSVPDGDNFIISGRAVASSSGNVKTPYSTIIPGRFYASSQINYSEIVGIGTSITVTTHNPSGFKDGSEFYLVNTLGTTSLDIDSTAVDIDEIEEQAESFDPIGAYTAGDGNSNTMSVDPWDYISSLNSKFVRCGAGGNIPSNNIITIPNHGFSNGQVVAAVSPTGTTLPSGITNGGRYYIRQVSGNNFRLATSNSDANVISFTANTGQGTFGLLRGYAITSINSTNAGGNQDRVTLHQNLITTGTTTSTPFIVIGATQTYFGTSTGNVALYTNKAVTYAQTTNLGTSPFHDYYLMYVANTSRIQLKTSAGTTTRLPFSGNYNATNNGAPTLIPVTLNPNRNTINIQDAVKDYKFRENDPIHTGTALTYRYSVGSGTVAIPGLTDNAIYYLEKVSDNSFGLKSTPSGSRIAIHGYPTETGTAHTIFTRYERLTQNTIIIPGHGLSVGQLVVYSGVGTGTTIGGLTEDQSYYIGAARSDTNNRITLQAVSGGSTIDLTSAGIGTHTLLLDSVGTLDGSYALLEVVDNTKFTVSNISSVSATVRSFDPEVVGIVSATDDTISIPVHRFITGTAVTYTSTYPDSTDIGGLTSNERYYVIRVGKDKIRLASSSENATNNTYIDLTESIEHFVGVGQTHTFTSNSIVGESVGVGSVSLTTGSAKVTGVDTKFLASFKSGDPFVVDLPNTNNGIGSVFTAEVASVGGDQQMFLTGTASTTITGADYLIKTGFYVKSEGFALHRPFDGGVEINAKNIADAQIIRQTRRYFRYQSGKGLNVQFAINFNPPIDAMSIVSTGTTALVTTRYRHQVSVGSSITVRNAEVSSGDNEYNGTFSVQTVPSETTFTYTMNNTPAQGFAGGFPEFVVTNWGGARMKAGAFDNQNGLFWEFDGTTLYAVRRNSIQQLAGEISATNKLNEIHGVGTRFLTQLTNDDRIVIRGQTYKVVQIDSNTTAYIQPAYRGTTVNNAIASKVVDDKVAQQNFSIDVCDGTGPNGYVLDTTRIQMAYIDYSWYGAGKGRFGFKDANGEVFYCHEFIHNNQRNEAYFRSGNMPARYEIENVGKPLFAPTLAHWGTTVQMDGGLEDDAAYLFTASSSLLTFAGSQVSIATTAGAYSGVYVYVNNNGSVATDIGTYSTRNFNGSSTSSSNGINISGDYITFSSNHNFATGQLVQYNSNGGTVVGGLTNDQFYYVRVRTNRTIFLYTSEATSIAGGSTGRVNITGTGTGTQHQIRYAFTFNVTTTSITGYGNRILHRIRTQNNTYSDYSSLSFGTPITSTAIETYGGDIDPQAFIYRVTQDSATSSALIDFFFANEPSSLNYPNFPSLGETGFIPTGTSSVDTFEAGEVVPVPALIPLISIRLAPSVDSGIPGALGVKEILNRMQLDLRGVGLLTTHDVDIRLILNGQIDNFAWETQGVPSLSQIVNHTNNDTIDSGINIFSFRASGGTEITSGGKRNANTFSEDISSLLSLGNSILGGDGIFPDGPDVLTLAVSPLNPSQITLASPLSVSGRITWSESQA